MDLSYAPLEHRHVPAVKALLGAILPVRLHDQMYRDAVACGDVSQLAFYCPPPERGGNGGGGASGQQQPPSSSTPEPEFVGALLARLEAAPGDKGRLYIAALAVAAPFRRRGIASELLRRSVAAVADDPAVFEAYLHVRVNAANEAVASAAAGQAEGGGAGTGGDNQDDEHADAAAARRWYAARGFSAAGVVEGYYSRLPPPSDALVMRRPLGGQGGS